MNPFFDALDQGYSEDDILGYISKALPKMMPMIFKAKNAGYTAKEIIGFLSSTINPNERLGMSHSERIADNNLRDAELTKRGLKIAAASVALPIAGTALRAALSHSLPRALSPQAGPPTNPNIPGGMPLPQIPQSLPSNTETQPKTQQLQQQIPASSSVPPVNTSNIPQNAPAIQPEQNITNVSEILNKHGLKKHVDILSGTYKDPKEIAGILYSRFPKEMKDFQKEAGKNMEDALGDYLQINKPNNKKAAENLNSNPELTKPPVANQQIEPESIQNVSPEVEEELLPETKPINKGSIAASPQGIGQVKEVRNGKALIDIDGKIHKVDEDELIESPLPEKDLDQLYDDLLRGIEKETDEDISRMVNFAGYDPKTNTLAFLPHSGALYTYENISPEDVSLLTDILSTRKTSGENFIGAWKAGSKSPIGAAMSQLIKRLQAEAGGKGKEYSHKFETVYSALEPAILAKKKKKKKK